MSHSQFHSIELFILRHAWLNLWDKHMTTGRINQVTILSDGIENLTFGLNFQIHLFKINENVYLKKDKLHDIKI